MESRQRRPKLSIVTVCLNAEETIQACLDSVGVQSFKSIEHIIIDGESEDGTLYILEKYKREVSHPVKISRGTDSGVYDAMNKGLCACSGEYVWFLNADDSLAHKDVLRDVCSQLSQRNPQVVAGHTLVVGQENASRLYRAKAWYGPFVYQQPHPSTLVHREFLEKNSIKFDSSMRIAADYKMQMQIRKEGGELLIIDEVLTQMAEGGISTIGIKPKLVGLVESYTSYAEVFGMGAFVNTLFKVVSKKN